MPILFQEDPLPVINEGECHIPVVIALDCSGSMSGTPIAELNNGLLEFGKALSEDPLALGRAEVCVIAFNTSVWTELSFRPASQYKAPVLSAGGSTSLNGAIHTALDAIEKRKKEYRKQGISYYRPWLFLLTDGRPTDTIKEAFAKKRLQNAIANKGVVYIPMGIGAGADKNKLQEYYPPDAASRPVLTANASSFKEAFVWLSNSVSVVSHSDPSVSEEVALPATPSSIGVSI